MHGLIVFVVIRNNNDKFFKCISIEFIYIYKATQGRNKNWPLSTLTFVLRYICTNKSIPVSQSMAFIHRVTFFSEMATNTSILIQFYNVRSSPLVQIVKGPCDSKRDILDTFDTFDVSRVNKTKKKVERCTCFLFAHRTECQVQLLVCLQHAFLTVVLD